MLTTGSQVTGMNEKGESVCNAAVYHKQVEQLHKQFIYTC